VTDPSAGAGSDPAPAGSSVDHQPAHGASGPEADSTLGASAGDHAATEPSGAGPAPAGTGADPTTVPAGGAAPPADPAPSTTPDTPSADDSPPVGFELAAPPAAGG
jgi:hypothetical protein